MSVEYALTVFFTISMVQDALVVAIEEMRALRSAVEQAEAAAQQARNDAANGGLEVLAEVQAMQASLVRAYEENEKVCLWC